MNATITDEIADIYEQLLSILGAQKYNIWFKNSTKLSLYDEYIKVSVPNKFVASWIENHFSSAIISAVSNVVGKSVEIAFSIEPELAGRKKVSQLSKSDSKKRESTLSKTNSGSKYATLNKATSQKRQYKLNLDDFVVGPCNKVAYSASRAIVENPETLFNPLFLHGSYGIGKTHLLQGVCNQVAKVRPNAKCIYVSAEEFTNQYVTSLRSGKLEDFRKKFRSADVLAIDDIHFLANKKSTQEEFLHTFNTIDLANKQVILASDAHPKMISQLTESLVNRFVSGMVVKLDKPSYETRLNIARRRAESMNVKLSDDVLSFVAKKVTKSVRELEGAILKLSAYSKISGDNLGINAVRQILKDGVASADVSANVSEIKAAVAAYFEVSEAQIASSAKTKSVSLARSVTMYLVRELSNLSYPEIGKMIGNKNHATVIGAYKKISKALSEDAEFSWKSNNEFFTCRAREIITSLKQTLGV